jgi:hypothetical protein
MFKYLLLLFISVSSLFSQELIFYYQDKEIKKIIIEGDHEVFVIKHNNQFLRCVKDDQSSECYFIEK